MHVKWRSAMAATLIRIPSSHAIFANGRMASSFRVAKGILLVTLSAFRSNREAHSANCRWHLRISPPPICFQSIHDGANELFLLFLLSGGAEDSLLVEPTVSGCSYNDKKVVSSTFRLAEIGTSMIYKFRLTTFQWISVILPSFETSIAKRIRIPHFLANARST
jgi:hypothetical protein